MRANDLKFENPSFPRVKSDSSDIFLISEIFDNNKVLSKVLDSKNISKNRSIASQIVEYL